MDILIIEYCTFEQLKILSAHSSKSWNIHHNCFINSQLLLSSIKIDGWLSISNTSIGSPETHHKQKTDIFEITNSTFNGGLLLQDITCHCDHRLFYTIIDGPYHIENAIFMGNIYFDSVNKGAKGKFSLNNIKAILPGTLEPLYRFAKTEEQKRGNFDASGYYYYLERKEQNSTARANSKWLIAPWSTQSKVRTWSEFIFAEKILGYGEKPARPIFWAIGTIFLFATIYFCLHGINPKPSSIIDYLYFSIVTFTTLGYGDFQPSSGLPRLLASGEAILGMIFMSLFVVVLTRKYIR